MAIRGEESLYELMAERRKEAREENRLVNPEPLFGELRERRKRIMVTKEHTLPYILVKRTGDFTEGVLRSVRSINTWTQVFTNLAIQGFFGEEMNTVQGTFRDFRGRLRKRFR